LESYDFDLGGLLKKMIKKLPILSKKKYVTILAVSRILKPLSFSSVLYFQTHIIERSANIVCMATTESAALKI
jgi:hypothetical protein